MYFCCLDSLDAHFFVSYLAVVVCFGAQGVQLSILPYRSFWTLIQPWESLEQVQAVKSPNDKKCVGFNMKSQEMSRNTE